MRQALHRHRSTWQRLRYRYYTCFSRHRYGLATCSAERLPADELDQAVLQAVHHVYQNDDLIARATADFQARPSTTRPQRTEELAAVNCQVLKTEQALDRYLQAFESGSMSEAVCGPRVQTLAGKLDELRTRQAELKAVLEDEKTDGPGPEMLAEIRASVRRAIDHGPAQLRKALLQELVARVRVDGRRAIYPDFRLPTAQVRPLAGVVHPPGVEHLRSVQRASPSLRHPATRPHSNTLRSRSLGIERDANGLAH